MRKAWITRNLDSSVVYRILFLCACVFVFINRKTYIVIIPVLYSLPCSSAFSFVIAISYLVLLTSKNSTSFVLQGQNMRFSIGEYHLFCFSLYSLVDLFFTVAV